MISDLEAFKKFGLIPLVYNLMIEYTKKNLEDLSQNSFWTEKFRRV